MLQQPVTQLSNRDLLAVLVGENAADCLLLESGGRLSDLFPSEPASVSMAREPGAAYGTGWGLPRLTLSAARELARRCLAEDLTVGNCLTSPRAVFDYLKLTLKDRPYEVFMVLWLDSQSRLIEAEELFRGTLSQTSVYPREIVKLALQHNSGGVVICHNHPSGVAEPSQADRWLTDQLKTALALVDVKVIDHVIVAGSSTLSFAERGWL